MNFIMKKISTIVLAGALAVGFASCNKANNSGIPEEGGSTYAQLTFKEAVDGPRADGQNDADGITGESEVANATFFVDGKSNAIAMNPLTSFTATQTEEKAYTSGVFEYKGAMGAGLKSGLVVNLNTLTPSDFNADGTKGIDQLATFAKKSSFVMSSKATQEIEIKENVEKTDVAAGNNQFTYDVERVVSKAQASLPGDEVTVAIKEGGVASFGNAAVKDFRYSVAGSAKEVYLFADHAGDRALGMNNVYKNYTSAIHSVPATTYENGMYKVQRPLQKVSEKSLVTLASDTKFAEMQSLELKKDDKFDTQSNENGIFFLENSVNSDDPDYADIVYFKFYGKFEPAADLYKLEGDKVVAATMADVDKDREEKVIVSEKWVNDNNLASDPDITKTTEGGVTTYTLTVKIAAGSIFYNPANRRFYTSPNAARVDSGDKTKAVETILYKGGKMLWKTPANNQVASKYFDTRRNNIYSVQVDKITGLGSNFDPADPADPNVPKPDPKDNPDEKPHKDEDKVITKTTNIEVQAKILKWNLVYSKRELGSQIH